MNSAGTSTATVGNTSGGSNHNNSNNNNDQNVNQDDSNYYSVPLTPGPSILAPITGAPASSGGVYTQDVQDNSGDRPKLHRRTYSSSSIINGGVVNLSTPSSSTNLTLQANASSNPSPSNNNNTSIHASDDNSTVDGIARSSPGSEINASLAASSIPNDGKSPSEIHNIPSLNTLNNNYSEDESAIDTRSEASINSIEKSTIQQRNSDGTIPDGSILSDRADSDSVTLTNGTAPGTPRHKRNSSLTIPIPPNSMFTAQQGNLSLTGNGSQTPTKNSEPDEFHHSPSGISTPKGIKKSTSTPVLNAKTDAVNTPMTPNGTNHLNGNYSASNSPISQFVTPLSSPLPRENSSGSLGSMAIGGSSVESGSSRRKINLRTPSFSSNSNSNISNGNSNGGSAGHGITLNIDEAIQKLLDAGYRGRTTKHVCLKNNEIALICQTARDIFLSQPVVLDLSPPVKVVGDVHGQYADLIRLFDMCGFPPSSNYLFLGDYVDRGKQSLETILLLFCYKIKYPENFFLLRGNHECASVTRVYGFYDECKRRTNIKTWKIFIDTFNTLPVAAIIAQKIFCVHGGLSPSLTNMNQLRSIQRPTDVPDFGLLNDILWSDPADTENEWEDNERGVSFCFNKVAINKFLAKFGFDLVCRAHIVVEDGYEFFNERTLVTVFSAPNYCGEFDNWGAVMSVSDDLLCSFELLKPLDSLALRQEMQKSRRERKHNALAASSLPGSVGPQSF